MNNNLRDLLGEIERVRAKKYDYIAPEFIEAIIQSEHKFPENDQAALAEIRAHVDGYLGKLES